MVSAMTDRKISTTGTGPPFSAMNSIAWRIIDPTPVIPTEAGMATSNRSPSSLAEADVHPAVCVHLVLAFLPHVLFARAILHAVEEKPRDRRALVRQIILDDLGLT